ncbi:MAG: Crp/Fnr family transcriptional regulator [Crocinitomicaceae bacterium]
MNIVEYVTAAFPDFSEAFKTQLIASGKIEKLAAGETLMSIGDSAKKIPLIVKGTIKVMREDHDGNELFLYYLNEGQTCAMSLNCAMINTKSEIHAMAEDDAVVISLPANIAGEWFSTNPEWQRLILETYQMRFREMLGTIDGIAFMQLDERVLKYLQQKKEVSADEELHLTHQQIADDLNSSREVISRVLKILEKKEKLVLGRNKIQLL